MALLPSIGRGRPRALLNTPVDQLTQLCGNARASLSDLARLSEWLRLQVP